jgi:putative ABC transport system ATP-binding protein
MPTAPLEQPAPAPLTARASVVCRGLTKEFRSGLVVVQALQGIDLDILPGELTLLVGPSGCGKTTLLSCIAGILDPTDGLLQVLGADVARLSNRGKCDFRRQNIGFVFQQFNLLPSLTAAENAAVPLIIAGVPRPRAVQKARDVLHEMGLGPRTEAYPAQLSGGQQQRVAIARAVVTEPRLIVCDEPTSALDAATGHTIMELLRGLALQPGRTVVVVTHDPRVFEFGDVIAALEDGRVISVDRQTPGAHAHHSSTELGTLRGSSTTTPKLPKQTP